MSTQYWEEELETMSREKLQELQLQRLKKTIINRRCERSILQRSFQQTWHHGR